MNERKLVLTFGHTPGMSSPIPLGQLLLDVENPRHGHVQSQRDAIQALIEDQKERLVKLAQDLGANGASPIDAMIVLKRGTNYVVLEGNRRLAAVRLINNPDLAKGTKYERDFKRVAKDAKATPTEFECWTASHATKRTPGSSFDTPAVPVGSASCRGRRVNSSGSS